MSIFESIPSSGTPSLQIQFCESQGSPSSPIYYTPISLSVACVTGCLHDKDTTRSASRTDSIMTVTGQSRACGRACNRVARAEALTSHSMKGVYPNAPRSNEECQVTVHTGHTREKKKQSLTPHNSDRSSQQCSTAVVRPPRGVGSRVRRTVQGSRSPILAASYVSRVRKGHSMCPCP